MVPISGKTALICPRTSNGRKDMKKESGSSAIEACVLTDTLFPFPSVVIDVQTGKHTFDRVSLYLHKRLLVFLATLKKPIKSGSLHQSTWLEEKNT